MPETKLKFLRHKSLTDLKRGLHGVNDFLKGKKVKQLCQSAAKLWQSAEKAMTEGDEEASYMYFMRFLSIVTMVQKSEEYTKDRDYFFQMVGKSNVNSALDKAEKLSKSLEQRYKFLQEQEEIEAKLQGKEKQDAEEELKRKQTNTQVTEVSQQAHGNSLLPGSTDISINSKQLYFLLKEEFSVLILDARSRESYAESHMNMGNCINVPEDIVRAGESANQLEKLLPLESKSAWSKRKDAHYVVLLDWSTTEQTHRPGSLLYTLRQILLKWDPNIVYKNPPVILNGGYEDWLITYPMCTTNPKATNPMNSGLSELDDLLDDVNYPNLENTLLPEPVVPDRTSKPPLIGGRGSLSSVNVPPPNTDHSKVTINASNRKNSGDKPEVDRSSKITAMQKYQEREQVANELDHSRKKVAELEKSKKLLQTDWELKQVIKEKEAEEAHVLILQNRQEELLESIARLEAKHRDQETERQSLKDEMERSKRNEAEAARLEEKARKQKEENEAKEEERRKLKMKREEQERKSAEERKSIMDAEKPEEEKKPDGGGVYYTQLKTDMASESGSNMKRSHSSPNIAQMMDNLNLKHKAPQFDRGIKPRPQQKPQPSEIKGARPRNFNPVYGCKGPGLTGLKNLGNTCYMNSIIQCINNTTPLAHYFVEGSFRDDLNYDNSTHGDVAEELAAVVRALWQAQFRFIACKDLKNVVGQYRKQFQGYEQQDSHEFFTILMDWLHEDLNKATVNSPGKELSSSDLSPADKAWEKFKRSNRSLIQSLFYGQQKSTVKCRTCGEKSVTYEAFSDLSLPIPSSSNKCSLRDCLQLYLNGETISGWNCPKCKEKRDAVKKFDIWRLPPILVIHLNRFYHDGWWRKRQTYVDFPFQMGMESFTAGPNQRYMSYNLYGVSNHYGSMEGGHYTAYCKNSTFIKWFKFDDHEVNEISSSDVQSGAAYILFYASAEYKMPNS